jgi:hypothetical protein
MSAPRVVAVSRRSPELSSGELSERHAADLARLGRFLGRLQDSGYFGKVTLSLQNGKLVELKTEQVLKIDDL